MKSLGEIDIIYKNSFIVYQDSLKEMTDAVEHILQNNGREKIIILQHKDVYTIGGSGKVDDVLDESIETIFTDRGGKVTYHGPGQLVAYFMLNIKNRFNSDVHKYVRFLEDLIIQSLKTIGVKAYTKDGMVGVWVKNKYKEEKIAAIGIKIRKWISYHGISINICPDLEKFGGIVPCGIKDYGVCSLNSLGIKIAMEEFIDVFANTLKTELRKIDILH